VKIKAAVKMLKFMKNGEKNPTRNFDKQKFMRVSLFCFCSSALVCTSSSLDTENKKKSLDGERNNDTCSIEDAEKLIAENGELIKKMEKSR
jgi:hypothetical protein